MKRIVLILLIIFLSSCGAEIIPVESQRIPSNSDDRILNALPACEMNQESPLSVIHFFDWYAIDAINGPRWTHKIDWAKYGLEDSDVGVSKAYYESQFKLINDLGVDGIMYEYYKEQGAGWPKLSANFLASLQQYDTKVGLFYDWEIQQVGAIGPVLSEKGYIQPTDAIAQTLVNDMAEFYERVPRNSWLFDKQGRLPMMIFGFGFNTTATDAEEWHDFYTTILTGLETRIGVRPIIYWTAINKLQIEYAFQYFPDQIRPFNFVLDNPQPQLAPGSVTWNINFDNLGVYRTNKLQRVIRDDLRYIQEMLWLAKYTAPELLFIYSWNEYYEGANIMPDTTYGETRYKLMQALLDDVEINRKNILPCTLLIVDDYADVWRSDDWHLKIAEQFTLYAMRRLAPQADVRLVNEITPELLDQYSLIIYLAHNNPEKLIQIEAVIDQKRVVVIGPRLGYMETLRSRFATNVELVNRNREVYLINAKGDEIGTLFARDDVFNITPYPNNEIGATIIDQGVTTPVLLRNNDDWWINAYTPDDRLLEHVFADIYGRPLEAGIMYGEGMRSQRLEIAPDGTVTQNTFSAPAIYQHERLPMEWNPPPPSFVQR